MTKKIENLDILEQTNDLREELNGASDRAAAIVAGAVLDSVLQELLVAVMIKDAKSDQELFNGSGALSTFSAKTEMAFRMGLISQDERRSITLIRKIRNIFAHQFNGASFALSPVKERTQELEISLQMTRPALSNEPIESDSLSTLALIKADSEDFRAVFSEAVISLNFSLITRLIALIGHKKESPADFVAAHEPIELMVTKLSEFIELMERGKKILDKSVIECRLDFEELRKIAPPGVDVIKDTKEVYDSIEEFDKYANVELPKLMSDTRARIHRHERWIAQIKAAHAAKSDVHD